MTCPIRHERLVQYWAGDLNPPESDEIEEHLFSCAVCFEAASRLAAVAGGLRDMLAPVVLDRDLARARAHGLVTAANDLRPGEVKETWFTPGVDVLVHRLVTDLAGVDKVSVELKAMDGATLLTFDDAPFDRAAGAVLVACRRHFLHDFPMDMRIVLHRIDAAGRETSESYTTLHRIG